MRAVLFIIAGLVLASVAWAADSITPGTLDLTPTFNCISVRANFTGDDNSNALAAIIWKPTADSTWRTTWTNYVDRRVTVNGNANAGNSNQCRISIFGMSPNTSYDVAVTWADADGGGASVTNTVTTLSWYPPTGGSDVWVDDDAASEGAGTEGDPYKTITNAIAQTSAGDTIRVKSGTYVPFTLSVSGTDSAWRMLKGEPGELVLIDGTAERNILISADYWKLTNIHFLQTTGAAVTVSANRHHHYFEHLGFSNISQFGSFTLDGQWPAGIVMRSGSSNLYVRDCDFLTTNNNNSVDGITIGGNENIVIISNRFHGNFRDSVGGGGATWNSGFRYNTDIAWNVVTNQLDDGLEIEGMNANVRTFGNYITTGVGSAALGLAPTLVGPHYVLRNYLINSNRVVFKIDNTSLGPLWIWHNTAFSVGGSSHIFSGEGGGTQTKLLLARNNLLKGSANMYWNVSATNDFDYGVLVTSGTFAAGFDPGNLSYSTLADWQSGTGYDANSIATDTALQSDFTILANSSAVDIGVSIPNINDVNSIWPANGAGPDIGAFEVFYAQTIVTNNAGSGRVAGFRNLRMQ